MSYHSHSKWQFGEPVTEEMIREVAEIVTLNGCRPPLIFAVLNPTDSIVFAMCRMLPEWRKHQAQNPDAKFEEFVGQFVMPGEEFFVEIASRVLPLVQFPPPHRPLASDAFKKITIPAFRRPFPPL